MPRPFHLLAGLAAAACLAAAGCGDSSSDDKAAAPTAGETTASAKPAAFPSSQGKTLVSLRQGLTEGPILAAGVSLLDVGRNRFSFALIDRARKQLTGAEVAVYVSDPEGGNVEGPFEARSESLAVDKRFQSKTTAQDPQAPESVYIVDLPFRRKGQALVMGIARLDGRLVTTTVGQVVVGQRQGPPDVGEKAISVHTPTLASVKGDASKIDTRVPPARDLLRARPRRRARQAPRRADVRHAAAVREPDVRPGRRRDGAGEGPDGLGPRLHPRRGLQGATTSRRAFCRSCSSGACRRSRGPS